MFDPRIYRAGFLPVLAAVVALLFSLEPAPEPLTSPVSTPIFEGRQTARLARTIADLAPTRTPGSSGDAAIADLVRERFEAIEGGEVALQELDSSFDGEDVLLQNVVLTLPGEDEEVLLVVAERDSVSGQEATSSAAATATLLSLAADLGTSRHRRTIVLASVSGSANGSEGIRELVAALPAPGGIEVGIVLRNPGVEQPVPPFVVPGRARPDSTSAGLMATAGAIASVQFEQTARPPGGLRDLARLALPFGTGGAAALVAEGVESLAVSGSGERDPEPDEGASTEVSRETVFAFGSTVLSLILTLDEATEPIPSGPEDYVRIGDNLLPGWTLALLALALILPSALAAGDVWLRDRRRSRRQARRSIPWALERAVPPLAALGLAYMLALSGLVPDPGYPYDPGRFQPGAEGPVAAAALIAVTVLAVLLVRPLRTPLDSEPQTLGAAAGLLCCLALAGLWLANPYLTLALAPAAHVWLLPARDQGAPSPAVVGVVGVVAVLPAVILVGVVTAALDLGAAAPWHLLLIVVSGQFGLGSAVMVALLAGGLLACAAAAGASTTPDSLPRQRSVLGPAGHAGPGSLGGTPSRAIRR